MENARILIVEDETIIAKDIEVTLRNLGYFVVDKAKRGEEAVEKAEEFSPHLVLMDIRLKGEMSGIDAANEIRKRMNVPIVYLTAHSDKKTLEQAKISDPFGYIVKPFVEHDLYTTIEIALYKHKIEKKLAESERKYRDLYNNAPDGYLTVDAFGWVREVNNTFSEMIGLRKEEIVESSIDKFIHETSKEEYVSLMEKIKNKMPFTNAKLNFVRYDGQVIPTLVNSNLSFQDPRNFSSRWVIRDMSDVAKLEKEKGLLQDRVIRLTRKIPLTENEKKVFQGLVAYPEYNDIELSKIVKIKRSTVTAIKNRLLKEGYYSSYKIPDFRLLGCELMIIVSARLNPSQQNRSIISTLFTELSEIPESVYIIGTGNNLLAIKISRNFTDFKKQMDEFIAKYKKNSVITETEVRYFPFETSNLRRFFDFTQHLSLLFELPIPEQGAHKASAIKRDFTRKEKHIFYALVKHGSLNDSEIALKARLPRPSISQIRRKLLELGYIREANIPDPLQLRSELIVQYSIRLDFKSEGAQAESLKARIAELPSTFFMLSNDSEVCSLHIYSDYSSSQEEHNRIVTLFQAVMGENFHFTIFPVTQLKKTSLSFAPLLRKLLDVKNSAPDVPEAGK